MRTLDDVYGSDLDRFPLEQAQRPPGADLEWDEPAKGSSPHFLDRLFGVHWGLIAADHA